VPGIEIEHSIIQEEGKTAQLIAAFPLMSADSSPPPLRLFG
jgi:hypothetical protein